MKKLITSFLIIYLLSGLNAFCQKKYTSSDITKVIFLGTGTPNPDPKHSGSSIMILVNNVPYIVDFGPGLIRKAAELSPVWGGKIEGFNVKDINIAFLSHMHSDHSIGFPDLILTPWVMGRNEALNVYGPQGILNLTRYVLEAYKEDINYRVTGMEPANNKGWRVRPHVIHEGIIYNDDNVQVEAFLVDHGSWSEAYGFRFTTPDRVIVISGDTKPCDNIYKFGKDADILIHEVYSQAGFEKKDKFWKQYHKFNHTSTIELADIAKNTNPGLLIVYHTLYWGSKDKDILKEIKSGYSGKVVIGTDLGIY